MIVLLELLTALLEYIDLILHLSFIQQEFTLSYKYLAYYAGIMLNAFRYLLCSKLCQHNRRVPTSEFEECIRMYHKEMNMHNESVLISYVTKQGWYRPASNCTT